MAKKKRNTPRTTAPSSTPAPTARSSAETAPPNGAMAPDRAPDRPSDRGGDRAAGKARAANAAAPAATIPAEAGRGDWTIILFALMMVFAPALGVPHEEMLQDTLKSIVVSFGALGAALIFFWRQRNRRDGLRWHVILWVPLAWMAYALGSMIWSHTYLGGVEAIRWFVFTVIVWMALNALSRERVALLLLGIHVGAVLAALWSALQFWVNFSYFPQGPNPASTFVNRNFIAEFLACTIPASAMLLAQSRTSSRVILMTFTLAFNVVVILMTGTRSAIFALALLVPLLALAAWRYRQELGLVRWSRPMVLLSAAVFAATIAGLGSIPTSNPKLVAEHQTGGRGLTALQRSFARTQSAIRAEEYTEGSFSIRLIMWKATMRMITKRPFTGVGAGAWEVDLPLYQKEGSQLETDYYVHNEILQLLAEYGAVGWITLIFLLSYLMLSAWRTWRMRGGPHADEVPARVTALISLFAFLVVSNAGFPWRLAATGAIFALCLGMLAASDARIGLRGLWGASRLNWRPAFSQYGAIAAIACLALAAYITQQAAECEAKIVRATKLSLGLSQTGDPMSPRHDRTRLEILRLVKEGTDINPHYRKITPMVADEFAKWGDWRNAVWIWESVVSSRPYVVAILSNIARGYSQMGDFDRARTYLERAKALQPSAPSVRSLDVVLLARSGNEPQALALARTSMDAGIYDFDMVRAAFVLGQRAQDWGTALKALDLLEKGWPTQKADVTVKRGVVLALQGKPMEALGLFREALALASPADRPAIRAQIPPSYLPAVDAPAGTPIRVAPGRPPR